MEGQAKINIERSHLGGSLRYESDPKTKFFDDLKKIPNLVDFKIKKIELWTGENFNPSSTVNGINVTHQNYQTGESLTSGSRVSEENLIGSISFELEEDEYLVGLDYRNGWVMDTLNFTTNTGRSFTAGGTGGSPGKFNLNDRVIIGFFGSCGTTLYSLGLYTISVQDYQTLSSSGETA
jgi:hypothetical protein